MGDDVLAFSELQNILINMNYQVKIIIYFLIIILEFNGVDENPVDWLNQWIYINAYWDVLISHMIE